jgi:hypothetical protein
MVSMIRRLFVDFNPKKIKLDAGGGGLTIQDLLRERWDDPITHRSYKPIVTSDDKIDGYAVLELVKFTDEKHNNLHTNLKSEMEHGRLFFPIDVRKDPDKNIEKIGQEIVAFKTELQVMTATPKGRFLSFEVPNRFRTDRVISTSLAIDCYLTEFKDSFSGVPLAVGSWASL